MKVSIAVPSFNYGQYIEACLESIRCQDHEDFEVLIADGGSSDESVSIIERYCGMDSRFRLVSRQDSGQVDAIKRAFQHATGQVFCFLNADDVYLCDDSLSSAVSVFRHYREVGVVTFGGYYVNEHGWHVRPVRLRYHPRDDIGLMKYRSGALQPATFWKRSVAEAIPLRPEYDYSFDTVFFYESFKQFSWLEEQKPVAGYRVHGANKSVQINSRRIGELAKFERLKFGHLSFRAAYLELVRAVIWLIGAVPVVGMRLKGLIRIIVNAMAYATAYRLPTI